MEYIILIIEFFYVKGLKGLVSSIIFPFICGFIFYKYGSESDFVLNSTTYITNVITLIGILLGFSISTLALLLTVVNENIDVAKRHLIGKQIFSSKLTLFDSIVIGLAYLIFVQSLTLIFNFIYPLFITTSSENAKMFYSINVSIVIQIIILLMRTILDFYFILSKRK